VNPPVATQRILYSVARRAGLDPIGEDANLSQSKAREILGFIDERLREGWESWDFVEITPVEERAFADDYNPQASYGAGAIVWDWCSRAYYKALIPTVGGVLSNTAVWEQNVNPPYPRMIPWWQNCHTKIGTCFSAWNKDPYSNQNRVPVPFLLSQNGLEFSLSQVTQTIWLQFRLPYPGIGLDEWNSTETYNRGDTCYYNMDTYISLIDENLNQTPPAVQDANWEQFRIPWVFKQFVTLAAFSDSLDADGQNEKAPGPLNAAYAALTQEYDKQTIQAGQFLGYSARVV
jgi:hypothetical protein